MLALDLPQNGKLVSYQLTGDPIVVKPRTSSAFPRIAYAAAHIVADPMAEHDPWLEPAIDWERTLAFRHRLWDLGLGVAESMDTAQRGMGLGWSEARELIVRSLAEAKNRPGALIACGAGTDHLAVTPDVTIDDVIAAYEHQIDAIEAHNGQIILMASRALAAIAQGPDDYARVYGCILSQVRQPVIIHWLGEMFDPALQGYWGSDDHMVAMENCLAILNDNAANIDGIKISLLSKEKEIVMRRKLSDGVRMYTGDDFNYAELIAGDDHGHSDALLGIFDAIAPAASAALEALGAGNHDQFYNLLNPTVPLSRHIFRAPTRFYKTGVVFLAYLNGLQDHFTMIGGQQSTRSISHLAELFRLADQARVLADPDLAVARMKPVLAMHGIGNGR
ncbi:dihydrodipicolinate synthase family protein [uncultured Thalassospira sp.]|uniref:dihydrodipicolinate synthase family protein n=1 Tax=uncultured Thalassospira sp. TaxID=404382 RepID=UPI0030D77C9A|tara:strand:+ start:761 stop:1933 length:1173 start_codon:yes stop_codon:yes gene_type:complete